MNLITYSSAETHVFLPKHINNYSRINLLTWVNATLSSNYNKVEEMCSGVAYCQLQDIIFPGSIKLNRLKFRPKLEHEYMENLKIFQSAFIKLKINKPIPIDRLVKGRLQDNLEFLQWYRNFFDVNCRNNNTTKNSIATTTSSYIESNQQALSSKSLIRTDTYNVLQKTEGDKFETINVLLDNNIKLKEQIKLCEVDRDFYFSKLKMIESVLEEKEAKTSDSAVISKILDVLYSEDETKISPKKPTEDVLEIIYS